LSKPFRRLFFALHPAWVNAKASAPSTPGEEKPKRYRAVRVAEKRRKDREMAEETAMKWQ